MSRDTHRGPYKRSRENWGRILEDAARRAEIDDRLSATTPKALASALNVNHMTVFRAFRGEGGQWCLSPGQMEDLQAIAREREALKKERRELTASAIGERHGIHQKTVQALLRANQIEV